MAGKKSTGPTRLGLKWLQLFPPKPKKATVGPASNRAGGAPLNTPPALNSHRLLLRPAYRSLSGSRSPPLPRRRSPHQALTHLVPPPPLPDSDAQRPKAKAKAKRSDGNPGSARARSPAGHTPAAAPVPVHPRQRAGAGVKGGKELMAPAQEEQPEALLMS